MSLELVSQKVSLYSLPFLVLGSQGGGNGLGETQHVSPHLDLQNNCPGDSCQSQSAPGLFKVTHRKGCSEAPSQHRFPTPLPQAEGKRALCPHASSYASSSCSVLAAEYRVCSSPVSVDVTPSAKGLTAPTPEQLQHWPCQCPGAMAVSLSLTGGVGKCPFPQEAGNIWPLRSLPARLRCSRLVKLKGEAIWGSFARGASRVCCSTPELCCSFSGSSFVLCWLVSFPWLYL